MNLHLVCIWLAIMLPATLGKNINPQISITLTDGIQFQKHYNEETFPDIGKLFGVKGTDVKSLIIKRTKIKELIVEEMAKLPNMKHVWIENNANIKTLPPNLFKNNPKLTSISLAANSIETMSTYAFSGIFSKEKMQSELRLSGNKLMTFPSFPTSAPGLTRLILSGNPITQINEKSLRNLPSLTELLMQRSRLKRIPDNTFKNVPYLAKFDVSSSTDLEKIEKNAFAGAKRLRELNLDSTKITTLQSKGLDNLLTLSFKDVNTLWSIPTAVVNLPKLRYVNVPEQRRFLCCAFLYERAKHYVASKDVRTNVTRICGKISTKPTLATTRTFSSTRTTMPSTKKRNISTLKATTTFDPWGRRKRALLWADDQLAENSNSDPTKSPEGVTNSNFGTEVSHSIIYHCDNSTNVTYIPETLPLVECSPGPDALRPCEDLMGSITLTTLSWLVSFLAVAGNGIVFIILVLSRRHFAVTKFLIINLVFADMCLGLYLFILTCASIDSSGEYYNSVVSWQYSGGCDVVGFLAIFSSELSMLVLTLITIERYLAIVYAVYLQKRLKMNQACILVGASWFIAILLATLPLTGVNNYRDVAICLPFSISSAFDTAYLGFVLGLNSLLFMIVLGCYVKIYYEVAGPKASDQPPFQKNDKSIAKRIALLVFTDFACWLPIAIVGIIAAAGYSQSIGMTVEKSKYLLVIFFPINSVCNPFLYALSTKTFRREFYTVLAQCGFCREKLHQFQSNTFTGNSSHKAANKNRRNTQTVTLDVQCSTAVENHDAISKVARIADAEAARKHCMYPSADLLIMSNNGTPRLTNPTSNNYTPNSLEPGDGQRPAETSFTYDRDVGCTNNNHPPSSGVISVVSVTGSGASLDQPAGVSKYDSNGVTPHPVSDSEHVVENAVRF